MITLTWEELVVILLVTLVMGAAGGWYGFYRYSNHHYMKYPEFFKQVLEHKIAKKQGKQP